MLVEMEEYSYGPDFNKPGVVDALFSQMISLTNSIYESRWEDDKSMLDDPNDNVYYDKYAYKSIDDYSDDVEEDPSITYERHYKNLLKNSPLHIMEGSEGIELNSDILFSQLSDVIDHPEKYNESDDNKKQKRDDGKIYINPFVSEKEKSRRDKTKYVEEHGDYLFEYDWNIISYDNYNTPDQDPFTYDYDFDLNKYKGVKGVYLDLGVSDDEYDTSINHTSYETPEFKFLPKAYRYAHSIAYTEAENKLLMIYDTTYTMLETMSRPEYCRIDQMLEENPALNYIQEYLNRYNGYIDFCEEHNLTPEWRDVHRHYGVWFKEPIITYQIWEEWYETEDDFKEPFLETILGGAYFDMKRSEVEDITSRLTETDKIMRAYRRHKDIYPTDEDYYSRYIPEDDAYDAVIGYDPDDGVVLRHDLQFDRILEATEEYVRNSEVDMSNYFGYDDMVEFCLNSIEEEEKFQERIDRVERQQEEELPFNKLEEKIRFYKETAIKKLKEDYKYDEIEDILEKTYTLGRIMDEAEELVEVETRPVLEMVCDKLYRPSIEVEKLNFNTIYKSLDDAESFQQLVNWRKGKFDDRAAAIIDAMREEAADRFYEEMTNSANGIGVDPGRKAIWDELWENLDEDELPPIDYGLTLADADNLEGTAELDVSPIFEPLMDLANAKENLEEFEENMDLLKYGSNLLCKQGEAEFAKLKEEENAQYNENEKDSLGLEKEDESYMYPKPASKEGEEIINIMRTVDDEDAARLFLNS